jgi:hypothetical protein
MDLLGKEQHNAWNDLGGYFDLGTFGRFATMVS